MLKNSDQTLLRGTLFNHENEFYQTHELISTKNISFHLIVVVKRTNREDGNQNINSRITKLCKLCVFRVFCVYQSKNSQWSKFPTFVYQTISIWISQCIFCQRRDTGQSRQGHKSISSGNRGDNSIDTIGHNLVLTKHQYITAYYKIL